MPDSVNNVSQWSNLLREQLGAEFQIHPPRLLPQIRIAQINLRQHLHASQFLKPMIHESA
jgi:hypothetical protein